MHEMPFIAVSNPRSGRSLHIIFEFDVSLESFTLKKSLHVLHGIEFEESRLKFHFLDLSYYFLMVLLQFFLSFIFYKLEVRSRAWLFNKNIARATCVIYTDLVVTF